MDKQKILLIDYDDTIHNTKDVEHPHRMGKPEPGAVMAVRHLMQRGWYIVIFTGRPVDKPSVRKAVADWLDYFQIPYHDITNVKPPGYGFIIDNKAIHYDSWERVLLQMSKLENRDYALEYADQLDN